MLKQRYNQAVDAVHADEELIERTLDAAMPWIKPVTRSVGFRVAVGFVCAFVLLVVAAARILPPPKDIVASSGQTQMGTDGMPPLNNLRSDELSLSVSDVKLENKHKFSFILTTCGDKIDQRSRLDLRLAPSTLFILSGYSNSRQDPVEGQRSNEQRDKVTIELQDYASIAQLGSTLDAFIDSYTIEDYTLTLEPEFDWAAFPFSLESSEPILQISDNSAITAIGFNDEGCLTVRLKWDDLTPDELYSVIWFTRTSPQTGESEERYMQLGLQYQVDDIWYYDYSFNLQQAELEGWQMVIDTFYTGEVIHGNWPFTVDLTQISPE